MNILSPVALPAAPVTRAPPILAVALQLLDHLERGQRIDAAILRAAMEAAFSASDTSGAWDWKAAYEACEVATVLFLRKYGKALVRPHLRLHVSPASYKDRRAPADAYAALEEFSTLQQFSTPAPLGLAAIAAASIAAGDIVLEPSAGTGLASPSWPRYQAERPSSTSWPKPAPICSLCCFRPWPSRASTPPRSMIISRRAPSPPSC